LAEINEENPINVIHYDAALTLDFVTKTIQGLVILEIEKTNDTDSDFFYIHLAGLNIDSASINGVEAEFSRQMDKVYFQPTTLDSIFTLQIIYSGTPGNDGFGGFFFKGAYAYTIGEGINTFPPSMLRAWMPSHDVPNDKATLDLHLTIPKDYHAFSNGMLISNKDNTDGTKTAHWQETHQISTYLVALAVGPYVSFSIPYTSISDTDIPLEFYVFPEHLQTAKEDWKNITSMMAFYENLFGPYPFDRYSMAEALNRGAMEHQTMTTYSSQLVTGDHRYDYIVAHELAHHWWGDFVTLADWKDLWLNEGFATYSEALYFEHLNGENFYQEYMLNLAELYFREVGRLGHFSIYDPEYLWGGTMYQKGAWVLHMLRWTIGKDAFKQTLKSYGQQYAYSNALITDFIRVAEEESGQQLDWFFDQWIYKPGYPDIDVSWSYQNKTNGLYQLDVTLLQKQWDQFQFQLPIEILIQMDNSFVLDTLLLSQKQNNISIDIPSRPISIEIDPNNWLLKQHDIISGPTPPDVTPDNFYLAQNYPNPFIRGEESTFFYYVAQLDSPHPVSIKIYNILGQEVKILRDKDSQGGFYKTHWDGRDNSGRLLPKGVYIYRLLSNEQSIEKKLVIVD
jgi:aminopeptidase N